MDWTWAIGGITDEVPRTAGPDCINYMTNQRRIVEAIFVSIVCLWVTHWSCKRMDPIEVPAGPPQPHSPMRLFLLILMCFIFGVEMGFKLAGESVIFVLNPCHIQTIIQIYLLAAKPSKLTIALFRIQLNYANGPFLASLFPEVESRTYAFERCTYWIQHALLYFIPVYMLRSGAYKAEKLKDFYWVAIGVSIMFLYHFTFLTYISVVKVYKTARTVPKELENVMETETFHKARLYGLDQEQFGIFKAILMDVIVVSLILYFGIIAYLWKKAELLAVQLYLDESSEIIVSCLFLFELSCISIVMNMPFEVYGTFVLEEKHGFNNQSAKIFIIDQIEGFVATQVISVPIVAAVVFIVQHGGEHFFIWLWLCNGIVSLFLLTIHPIFIAPFFDDYTPLEDGTLRESIENLAASLEFPLTKVYVVDGSKRSAHSNAYFYGLWGSKRIVLFDTLLLNYGKNESELKEEERGKGCTDEEVLAVLAHELGHWKLGHVTKNIIIIQVHLLLIFAAFGYLFQYGPFYEAVGFESGQRPILVGLLVVVSYVMLPYIALINFGMKVLSRKFEYEADDFAQKLGFADLLSKALIKLNIDNLEFPAYDWLYSSWNHSHPTLLQRLDRLKEIERE